MLNRYGPWLDINIVEATGPQTCRVRFEYFLHQGHEAEEEFVEESLQASDAVQQEDVRLCEAVQRGLRSPAYDSGRSGLVPAQTPSSLSWQRGELSTWPSVLCWLVPSFVCWFF